MQETSTNLKKEIFEIPSLTVSSPESIEVRVMLHACVHTIIAMATLLISYLISATGV